MLLSQLPNGAHARVVRVGKTLFALAYAASFVTYRFTLWLGA